MAAALAEELHVTLIDSYLSLSASVLFVFDYCLTIGQEAHVVWKRRWTIATWLFIVTRYVALLSAALQFLQNGTITSYSCAGMIITTSTLSIAKFLCFAVFSALRVFALLDGHFFVTAVVFLLTAVPAATNIYKSSISSFRADPEFRVGYLRCQSHASISEKLALGLSLVTRLAVIVADILVILTTWSKTLSAYRTAQRHKFKAPLVVMLFRDGTLYFIILLVMNVIVVLRNNIPSWEMYDFASPFLETFTSIIICRFILNLRQVGADDDFEVSGCQSTVVRFVANLGQSVGIGGWDADDVESEGTYRPESMELGKVADKGLQHKDHVGMNSLEAATTEPEQRVA